MRIQLTAAMALLLSVSLCWAQAPTGTISGSVSDGTGAVIPGATVIVVNPDTNFERTIQTNESGVYNLPSLLPGSYTLRIESDGFNTQERTGIILQVGQTARIDVELEVGAVGTVVEVTGGAPVLQADTTELGTVIENRRILDLPLNGRNYLQLASLTPGATSDGPASSQGQQRMGGQRNSFALNVAGQRVHFNHYSLDGLENTDPNFNSYLFLPNLDILQEFKVESGIFSAEYGRAIAQVNVSTKSGTNQIHGTAYNFLRNSELDAKNYFDDPNRDIPPFKRNQYGVSVAGPLVKNKVFFLFGWEGLRERRAATNVSTLPRPIDRAGDFSASALGVYDPATRVLDGNRRVVSVDPFPNFVIPANRISPTSKAILDQFFPLPNQGAANQVANNFLSNEGERTNSDQLTSRFDWNESASSNWFARYSISDELQYQPLAVPDLGTNVDTRVHQGALANTRIFGPSVVNEMRLGVSRLVNGNIQQRANGEDIVRQLGIGGLATNPLFYGVPVVSITGFSSVGECNDCPFVNWDMIYQFKDDMSWTTGKHSIKFGTDLRHTHYDQIGAVVPRGRFNFNGQYTQNPLAARPSQTGEPMADFLLGHMSNSEGQVGAPIANFRNWYYSFYVQDNWRVTNKLTLNLGLRWEMELPYRDRHDAIVNFDFAWDHSYQPIPVRLGTGDPNAGSQGFSWPDEVGYVRDGRFGNRVNTIDWNDWAPRIGAAYQLNDKTVIRTGAGLYYVRDIGNGVFDVVRNSPFTTRQAEPADPILPNQTWARPFTLTATPSFLLINQFDEPTSYVAQYSFGIQRQLTKESSLEVTYLGSAGVFLRRLTNYNQAPPGPGNQNPRRPFPIYGTFQNMNAPAHSSYHALQARFQHRFQAGLTVLSSFAYGKSIDNGSGVRTSDGDSLTPSNNDDLSFERGLSAFHFRSRWTTSYLYELPFGKGKRWAKSGLASYIAGGWQIGGIFTIQEGFPLTARCGPGANNFQNGGGGCYPDVVDSVGGPNLPRSERTPERFFNPAAFVDRLPGGEQFRFGNSARNTILGPGILNTDLSIVKNIPVPINEATRLEFRAEFFNIANHPILGTPGTSLRQPSTGVISSTRIDNRTTQLALKFYF